MDLEKLRQARLQRYSGVGSASSSTFNPDLEMSTADEGTASLGIVDPIEVAPDVKAETSGLVFTSDAGVVGILTEVRDLLVQLPANIAAALAVPGPAAAPLPAILPAPQPTPQPAPQGVSLAASQLFQGIHVAPEPQHEDEEADMFAETPATGKDEDLCGVCHMPVPGQIYSFDICGHYPFCTHCVEVVKSGGGPSRCPYCKTEGKSIQLHFEE